MKFTLVVWNFFESPTDVEDWIVHLKPVALSVWLYWCVVDLFLWLNALPNFYLLNANLTFIYYYKVNAITAASPFVLSLYWKGITCFKYEQKRAFHGPASSKTQRKSEKRESLSVRSHVG